MITVGLTGGYATGKSFVASQLERLGCHLIYADSLGRAVQEPGGEAYRPIVETFGPEILEVDETINRKKLASIVFSSPELLAKLNSFVHPAVFRLEEKMLKQFEVQDPGGISVIEAAILIETGRYTAFDRIILTVCDEAVQIARALKRDGISRAEVLARIARQLPIEQKRIHAHYVIDTNGSKENTIRQVEAVYEELNQLAIKRQQA